MSPTSPLLLASAIDLHAETNRATLADSSGWFAATCEAFERLPSATLLSVIGAGLVLLIAADLTERLRGRR